jgi:cellulose biosynthesis protein BcsQ
MRVVLFSPFKGGVGKTTCAINVASAFCSDHSVVLLDGDRNRSAKQWASQGRLGFPVVNESEEIPECDLLLNFPASKAGGFTPILGKHTMRAK